MAKSDSKESKSASSTSSPAESKSSGATSSTSSKATQIDTSAEPGGYDGLSAADQAAIDRIMESQRNPGQIWHSPAYDEAADKVLNDAINNGLDSKSINSIIKEQNKVRDEISSIVNNRNEKLMDGGIGTGSRYNNLKHDLDTLSYFTNPNSPLFDGSTAQYGERKKGLFDKNKDKFYGPNEQSFYDAYEVFNNSKTGINGLLNTTGGVLNDFVRGYSKKTIKSSPEVPVSKAPEVLTTENVKAPKGLTAADLKERFGSDAAAAAEWMRNNPDYKAGPATEEYMNSLGYAKGADGSFTESGRSRGNWGPISVDFSGINTDRGVFGEMAGAGANLSGSPISSSTRPKADSIESSDNSSYNYNSPSSGGYSNNSVSTAAGKQYRKSSRNSESIGLADDPNRANYNDDWNRGMIDKSTDIVSDENAKCFVKKVVKRDPLNRTIVKKVVSRRG